ncbi:HAD-like domain-containing protein [Fomitopsis serialis]|uniref:HAD-like domain-containing protein n=1 Tax=Fomitopsis serialis TaxID=139415 RepID=UPI0020085DD1|nr:HAD-like domain-containing protein [Neoantrodia serialis]KAH9913840.1 HAD-like domain-containing protein [Neoantrodia serialis]
MTHRTGIHVLAFDIYGTILNTNSITSGIKQHSHLDDEKAAQLSQLWRRYQLEYTWRLNSMGLYEPFDTVTKSSLKHAAAEMDIILADGEIAALMSDYSRLLPFEDAVPALEELSRNPNIKVVIFSNGTEQMVSTALHASLPEALLPLPLHLADSVRQYKPAPSIYDGLRKAFSDAPGAQGDSPDVWLVSGNPFDVTGARAAGLGAFWVDRAGGGWKDQIPMLTLV